MATPKMVSSDQWRRAGLKPWSTYAVGVVGVAERPQCACCKMPITVPISFSLRWLLRLHHYFVLPSLCRCCINSFRSQAHQSLQLLLHAALQCFVTVAIHCCMQHCTLNTFVFLFFLFVVHNFTRSLLYACPLRCARVNVCVCVCWPKQKLLHRIPFVVDLVALAHLCQALRQLRLPSSSSNFVYATTRSLDT